jgi:hypothetical protein
MSRITAAVGALSFFAFAPVATAICTLNVRFSREQSALVWDAVPGVQQYEVQESLDDFQTSRNFFINDTSFPVQHRASSNASISYIVSATIKPSVQSVVPSTEGCVERLVVDIPADPQFRALTRKAVVPLVGSIAGAFGGRFKTSLKLTSNAPAERGRLVFHPVGLVASVSDPSMPYAFGLDSGIGATLQFDDVVAAMGQSGVGSLDIIPDDDAPAAVPTVDVRLYNDSPEGTFGTSEPAVLPFDFLQAPAFRIVAPPPQFRLNVGIRTLTATKATVLVFGTNRRLREFRDLQWPADYSVIGTARQIIGVDVAPDESLEFIFDGAAIPFYTVTENRTNDPELFIAAPAPSNDVGSFVE